MCTCTCINHICIKFFYLLFQNFRQKMDYFKEIKSSLEQNDCLKVFKSLNNDQDFFHPFKMVQIFCYLIIHYFLSIWNKQPPS